MKSRKSDVIKSQGKAFQKHLLVALQLTYNFMASWQADSQSQGGNSRVKPITSQKSLCWNLIGCHTVWSGF